MSESIRANTAARFILLGLLLVWLPGMWLSWENLSFRTTGQQSLDEIEERAHALRPHLEGVESAAFLTDRPARKKIHHEFYRTQYAVPPTVLEIAYSKAQAWRLLETEGIDHVVVIYRKSRFFDELRRDTEVRGHRFLVLEPGIALIFEEGTDDGS